MQHRPFIGGLIVILAVLTALPLAQAGWVALGPFGGEANIIRVSSSNRDLVVAAAHNGMLFRSTDSGAHWTPQRFPLQLSCMLHAFEIDPEHADTWYAGIESGYSRRPGCIAPKTAAVPGPLCRV